MRTFLILAIVMIARLSIGQELYRISHYNLNSIGFSPSTSILHDGINVSTLFRKQWVSLPGSPTSGFVSVSSSLKGTNFYLSGVVFLESVSIYSRNEMDLGLSYKLRLNDKSDLGIGISVGYNSDRVDYSRAMYELGDELIYSTPSNSSVRPMINASATYQMASFGFYASCGIQDATIKRNLFFSAGKMFEFKGSKLSLSSSVLGKMSIRTNKAQMDLNTLLMYNKQIGIGVGYRLNNELILMGRINLIRNLEIGYAYDLSMSLNNMQGHEIWLRYKILNNKSKQSGYTNPII